MNGLSFLAVQLFSEQRDYLLLVGVVMVTVWLLFRYRKKRRSEQRVGAISESQEAYLEQVRRQRGMKGDLEDLMSEIEQMAKRLSAHLDAKTVHLDHLIEEADRRIVALQRLEGERDRGEAEQAREPDLLRAGNGDTSEIAGGVAAAVEQSGGGDVDMADPLAASIYELADQGLAAEQIAKKIDEHIGKVELILALRKT